MNDFDPHDAIQTINDNKDAYSVAKGNNVSVTTNGEGQALYIANLMVTLVDNKIAETNV